MDYPRVPGVKNLLCNAWDMDLIPNQELRSHMPLGKTKGTPEVILMEQVYFPALL